MRPDVGAVARYGVDVEVSVGTSPEVRSGCAAARRRLTPTSEFPARRAFRCVILNFLFDS